MDEITKQIDELKEQNRNYRGFLKTLIEEYKKNIETLENIGEDYNEALLSNIGKGKYYKETTNSLEINSRLNDLKNRLYNANDDENIEEYQSEISTLEAELSKASENEKNARLHIALITAKHENLSKKNKAIKNLAACLQELIELNENTREELEMYTVEEPENKVTL